MSVSYPIIQVSIDTKTIEEGVRQAKIALASGADWIEVGTSLITFEGLSAIDSFVSLVDSQKVLVDYKTLDGVAQYFEATGQRGAHIATTMAITNEYSLKKAIEAGRNHNVKVMVDLFSFPVENMAKKTQQIQALGADYVLVHLGIDEFRDPQGEKDPLKGLDEVVSVATIPVAVVVFTLEQAIEAVARGARIILIGTPIIESENAQEELSEFIKRIKQ